MEILDYIFKHKDGDWKEKLLNDHGIKTKVDPMFPELVNLCYDQLASKKTHPLTIECRGLVIDEDSLKVQSSPFYRFFNYGEAPEFTEQVNFNNCVVYEKLDGSLITLYYSERYSHWMVSTKGTPTARNVMVSINNGNNGYPYLFLVAKSLGIDIDYLFDNQTTEYRQEYLEEGRFYEVMQVINERINEMGLDKTITYVFELVSPKINIVTQYDETEMYLIGMFHTPSGTEYTDLTNDHFKTPKVYQCSGIDDIKSALRDMNKDSDIIREGFVVQCLDTQTRVKIKNGAYLKLHQHNSLDDFDEKSIKEIVADGEEDEILTYYPELKDRIDAVIAKRDVALENIKCGFDYASEISDRKELAMKLKDLGVASVIFYSMKFGIDNVYQAWDSISLKMKLDLLK